MGAIGHSVPRKEAYDKVTGAAKYNNDFSVPDLLHCALVRSQEAHARLVAVDVSQALRVPGVRAVVVGADTDLLCGEVLEDRPPLARDKVRYYGEPVAAVVAEEEAAAAAGAAAVQIQYEPLPVVNDPRQALRDDAPLVHEQLGQYKQAQEPVDPKPGTNLADHARLRKGDMEEGWRQSEVTVELDFSLPQLDHAAMETRSARVEITPDGRVHVHTSSQAPFEVKKMLAKYFKLDEGKVIVHTPLVGGGFGGKAAIQLEVIACLASKAVGGRPVKLVNTREMDIAGSPVGHGLEGQIRLGATRQGRLTAAEMHYLMDIGAYTDSAPRIARAIAAECTGPYRIDNVHCDVLLTYTNHIYSTAYRSFGHMPMTFPVERAIDKLAHELGIDPWQLRRQNAVHPGDTTPTQTRLTRANLGDLPACLDRLKVMIGWEGPQVREVDAHRVRATGLATFWKTSSSPPNAVSGALATMNSDGSINLSIGAVEFGPGTKTAAAQIMAEAMGMDVDKIHIHMDVNTMVDPEHWKTVASLSTFMVGRAVIAAARDMIRQLKAVAAAVLKCPEEDLEVGDMKVYLKDDPETYVRFKDIALGYRYPEGDSIGGQIMGRGGFIVRHLTLLHKETGKGRPGPSWTVGAQAVEVELNRRDFTYKIVRAATVIDAGRVINPKIAKGQVMGGMCMGVGYASREYIVYDHRAKVLSDQFRTYRTMRVGEQPAYLVDFIETPQAGAPFGARPIGEHGVIAMPAALANALSLAAGQELNDLPLTPERLWRAARRKALDPVHV